MIVWLASYPRSGNTYLRIVLHHVFGRKSMSIYQDEPVHGRSDDSVLRSYSMPLDRPLSVLAAAEALFFVKTHDLPKADDQRAIYIVRDGRDALVSYAWFVLQFEEHARPEDITRERFEATLSRLIGEHRSPFGTWSTHIAAWRAAPGVEVIRFEDLLEGPRCVETALTRLGIPLGANRLANVPTFATLQHLSPGFFRRGQAGAWRDEFPSSLLTRFETDNGDTLRELGYIP